MDDLILQEQIIPAARQYVENEARRALINSQWRDKFDCFADELRLGRSPLLASPALVVKYLDAGGAEQTLDPSVYRIDADSHPPVITLALGQSWPATASLRGSVTVEYWAGHGTTEDDVPPIYRRCVLMLAAYWYGRPEAFTCGEVERATALSLENMIHNAGATVGYA